MPAAPSPHDPRAAWRQRNPGYYAKYAAANPDKILTHQLSKYRISAADFAALAKVQGGVCAICRKPETARSRKTGKPRRLSVDHCHETGMVRGLLCTACNTATVGVIEALERDHALHMKFRAYLTQWTLGELAWPSVNANP